MKTTEEYIGLDVHKDTIVPLIAKVAGTAGSTSGLLYKLHPPLAAGTCSRQKRACVGVSQFF